MSCGDNAAATAKYCFNVAAHVRWNDITSASCTVADCGYIEYRAAYIYDTRNYDGGISAQYESTNTMTMQNKKQ